MRNAKLAGLYLLATTTLTTAGQAQRNGRIPVQPSISQIIAVAADSSGRTSLQDRARAIRTLGSPCTREAVPLLSELGKPYRRAWVIWHGALAALAACPYEQLASLWRETITFPRQPVREIAIVGLLRTGSRGDIGLIREATHRETDPLIVRLAELADSLLRLPIAERAAALRR